MVVHGPAVCEHCILTAQLHPGRKPRKDSLGEPELKALFTAVKQWESWLDACETSAPEGFIAAKRTGLVWSSFAGGGSKRRSCEGHHRLPATALSAVAYKKCSSRPQAICRA